MRMLCQRYRSGRREEAHYSSLRNESLFADPLLTHPTRGTIRARCRRRSPPGRGWGWVRAAERLNFQVRGLFLTSAATKVWVAAMACLLMFTSLTPRALAENSGSGPEISVPKDLPRVATHQLPERNWIDQTQSEADRKSVGCLECHSGSEPMHASPYVVLGCTDCHG